MGKFQVGDRVRIIDVPNKYCAAGWNPAMDKYCGKEAVITSKYSHYKLDIDNGEWYWSSDIIRKVTMPELPDLDPVPPEALQILFG